MLVTVVVVGCPLTVFVGRLTVAFFVEVTVVVDCGFLAPVVRGDRVGRADPGDEPDHHAERGPGDEREQARHPRKRPARAQVLAASWAEVRV